MKREAYPIRKWDPEKDLKAGYNVPASKSVLARDVILLSRMGRSPLQIRREYLAAFSDEEIPGDVKALLRALDTPSRHDCGESGTALRFLTAYYAARGGGERHLFTGSSRLAERPMRELLELLEGGAGVRFAFRGKPYALPFELFCRTDAATAYPEVVDASAFPSSQFVSALLLSGAPSLFLLGEHTASLPYVDLTVARMERFGYRFARSRDSVRLLNPEVTPQLPDSPPADLGDWSSAWYWIEHLILQPRLREIHVRNLAFGSAQPDEELFLRLRGDLGLEAESASTGGVTFRKTISGLHGEVSDWVIDFSRNPDQYLTIACIALGQGRRLIPQGVSALPLKESDRLGSFEENARRITGGGETLLNSFGDHRVAMSFALLAASPLCPGRFAIDDAAVVAKSYPTFFSELFPPR